MDDPLHTQLSLIKQLFPKHELWIEQLYLQNADFKGLCDDYYSCVLHLQKFRKEFADKVDNIKEYENVRKILEDEIREFISE